VTIRSLHDDGNSGERVVDRSAHAELTIDATVSGGQCRQEDASDEFVRPQRAVVVA